MRSAPGARIDEGSATVVSLALVLLLSLLCVALVLVGSAILERQRAQAAADLAALAAATRFWSGPDAACSRARAVATRNGALLVRCLVLGGDARVVVRRPAPPMLAPIAPDGVLARARAGVRPAVEPGQR